MLCSDEFGPLARAETQVLGLPELPLVALPHPLAGNAPALVAAKALAIVDEVERALCDSIANIIARENGRFLALTDKRLSRGAVCIDSACALDPSLVEDDGTLRRGR